MTDAFTRLIAALADRYRIERELGEGGMATVYLAEDLKHHREVAIKVLKRDLAAVVGPERFLAEIRTTANLEHPGILPLHDSGEAGPFLYYVMPFVDGESLRERLDREHQLPVDDAVKIAGDVAEALEYAHGRGVVHRDVKPANILLVAGRPVISDFGIALAVGAASGTRLTETGLSLGTPHYMSPEQATGDAHVGPATDIYALGCVLYEMLTGDPPHTGRTPQAVLGKIITEPPASVAQQRRSVPANVTAATAKALEKLPADRFVSAKAFAEALRNPAFALSAGTAAPSAGLPVRRSALFALIALTALFAAWGWLRPRRAFTAPVARFSVTLPKNAPLRPPENAVEGGDPDIAMSPDGARIAYVGPDQLYLRALAQLTPTPIPGTKGGAFPFFSPDGMWLGFLADGKVQKVPLAGGPPLTVCTADSGFYGASWGADGQILFATGSDLREVSAAGGQPAIVVASDSVHGVLLWPEFLPDGKTALFTIGGFLKSGRLAAVNTTNGRLTRFDQVGSNPHYVRSGYVILANLDGSLVVVPFDASRVAVTGGSAPLAQNVEVGYLGDAKLGVAWTGAFVYAPAASGLASLVLVDRHGVAHPVIPEKRRYASPQLSPDGSRLTMATVDPNGRTGAIWVYDLVQGTLTRLSSEGNPGLPRWTPDGRRVTYTVAPGGGIAWVPADGSAPPEPLPGAPPRAYGNEWTPDGRTFIYHFGGSKDLYLLRTDSGTSHPYLTSPASEWAPAVSPDGHWLAYSSDESSRQEIYVRSFPNPGRQWQVSLHGGTEPRWSRDERELFYRNADTMMVAAVHTQPTFGVGERRVLFTGTFISNGVNIWYDVKRDGRGFYMVQPEVGTSDMIVVLHWFDQ